MGMGFAPTWLRQVKPLLHKTTSTTALTDTKEGFSKVWSDWANLSLLLLLPSNDYDNYDIYQY